MKIPKLTEIHDFFSTATYRFPATVAIFWVLFITASVGLYVDNSNQEYELARVCLGLGILVPFSLIVQFIGIKWPSSWKRSFGSFALLALIFALSYWFLIPDTNSNFLEAIRYGAVIIAAHLILAIVPLFFQRSNYEIWHLNSSMLTRWLIGLFYCVVIYSGLCIALVAADNLFSIHIGSDAYVQLYFAVAFIVHPYYFLGLWKDGQLFKPLSAHVEGGFQILIKYIMIPLVILYFVILYAYGLKILITFDLPKGWVASLILGFAGIAILCYLVNYLFAFNKNELLLDTFDRWIFPAILPLLPLLYIAIFRRINEYGFTVERYVVLALSVWLSITTLWFLWNKNRKLAFIPLSLLVFIVIGFFSPVDAFHVSARSQTNRLIGILDSNKLITSDGFVADITTKIKTEQAQSLASIISALDELKAIPNLPLKLKEGELNASNLRKQLQIENVSGYNSNSIYYGFSLKNGEKIANPSNRTIYFKVQDYDTGTNWHIVGETCSIEASNESGIGRIDLTEYCKSMEKLGQNSSPQNIDKMSYTTIGQDGLPVTFTFFNFSFNKIDNTYRINSADGIASK